MEPVERRAQLLVVRLEPVEPGDRVLAAEHRPVVALGEPEGRLRLLIPVIALVLGVAFAAYYLAGG